MKKFLMLLLTVVLLVANTGTVDAAKGSVWSFGDGASSGTTTGSKQGENGWYFMWTPEVDKGGSFSESKIKECVAARGRVSTWVAYNKGLIAEGGTMMWVPEIYTDSDYNAFDNNNWWLQDLDGTISPAVVLGERASNVIGWKAQEAGTFKIEVSYSAGCQKDGQNASESDGVTVSINVGGKCKDKHKSGEKTLDSGELSAKVSLKKGDMVYVIADANGSGAYDTAKVGIKITQTKEESSSSDKTDKTDSNKTDKTESNKTDKTESSKTESSKTDSSKTESSKTESSKTESSKTESSKTESSKTDSSKTEATDTKDTNKEETTTEQENIDTTDVTDETETGDDAAVDGTEDAEVTEDEAEEVGTVTEEQQGEAEETPEEEPASLNPGLIVGCVVVVAVAAVGGVVFYKKKGLKK